MAAVLRYHSAGCRRAELASDHTANETFSATGLKQGRPLLVGWLMREMDKGGMSGKRRVLSRTCRKVRVGEGNAATAEPARLGHERTGRGDQKQPKREQNKKGKREEGGKKRVNEREEDEGMAFC
ncbi:hypothetical protein C8R47DRAFT_1067635 [Mycena vitilis]|nr:hypothetical protein C8R47DRAFT_1067635 [Mycena vitilis]